MSKKHVKKNNRTTIPGFLYELTPTMVHELDTFMYDYGFMFRHAFKRYIEFEEQIKDTEEVQKKIQKLEKDLATRTNYPIRVAKDAVADAVQLAKSQHEFMKDYLRLWVERYENTSKRYNKLLLIPSVNPHSIRMTGLKNKMEKQLRKIHFYQKHIQNNTFPPVIFGGKENYYKRQKGLLSKKDWNEFRNGRISSRGDATKGGNPNLRVLETEDGFALQITSNRKFEKGKKIEYDKTIMPLNIATKKDKNTGQLKGRKYPEMMKRVLQKGSAYEVEILKRKGKYYVHIVLVDEIPPVNNQIDGWLGVDTNIDGLALCRVQMNGSPTHFEWKGDGGLQYYPSDKRNNIIWEFAHHVVGACLKYHHGLAIEDLDQMHNREIGKPMRRKINQFCYRHLLKCMENLCVRYGIKLIKVKPQYTSVIGRLKYQNRNRVNTHLAAAYVIARRAIGYKEEVPNKIKSVLTKKQIEDFSEKNEWKQWSIIKKRITTLLKKRKAKFYQWNEFKKDVYLTLNNPKKKKVTA